MTPGRRRRSPDRFATGAAVSALVHAAVLAAALLWFGRPPPPLPTPERGVEIVWDEASGEAVGEATEPDPPGAPPSPPAPPEVVPMPDAPRTLDVPPPPRIAEQPQLPMPPTPPPPAPMLAEAPPAPAPAPDLPLVEVPVPDVAAIPQTPPRPESPPTGEPEALPVPPPEPPAPPPRLARPPSPEPARPGAQAAARSASGVGRATGAVVAPGLDPSYRNTAPAYPEAARLRGDQGAVGMELSINAQGRVVSVVVARSSGSPALDQAARRAVAEWRFRPATVDGQPVPGAIRTTVHFRLQ